MKALVACEFSGVRLLIRRFSDCPRDLLLGMNDIVELLPASVEQIAEMFPEVYPDAIAQRLRKLEVRGEVCRVQGVFFKTTRDRDDDHVSHRSGR